MKAIVKTSLEIKSSLEQLAEQIKAEHQQFESDMRASLAHAIKAGDLLNEAKALVSHGQWGAWLIKNCKFPERTAQAYMQVAKAQANSKAQSIADLTFSGALKMLAEPRPTDPETSKDLLKAARLFASEFDQWHAEAMITLAGCDAALAKAETVEQLTAIIRITKRIHLEGSEKRVRALRHLGQCFSMAESIKPEWKGKAHKMIFQVQTGPIGKV